MELHTITSIFPFRLDDLARKFGVPPQSLLARNPSLRSTVFAGKEVPPGTLSAPRGPSVSSFRVVTRDDVEAAEVAKRASVVAAIYRHCGRLHKEGEVVGVPQLLLPSVQEADGVLPPPEVDTKLSELVSKYAIDFDTIRANGGIPVDVLVFAGSERKKSKRGAEKRQGTLKELAMSKTRGRTMAQVKNITSDKVSYKYNTEFDLEQVVVFAGTPLPKLHCNYKYTQTRPDFRMSRVRAVKHRYGLPSAFGLPRTLSMVTQAPLPDVGVAESSLLRGHDTVGIHTIVASRGVDVHIVSLFTELHKVLVFIPGAAVRASVQLAIEDPLSFLDESDSDTENVVVSPRGLAETLVSLGDY